VSILAEAVQLFHQDQDVALAVQLFHQDQDVALAVTLDVALACDV